MSTPQARGVSLTDAELEAAIEIQTLRFQTASTIPRRREAWRELQRMIGARSPEQVRWMEEQRGLAR